MRLSLLLTALLGVLPAAEDPTGPVLLPVPPQDQGLPYTRSGDAAARAALAPYLAIAIGSRYAWLRGARIRLDDRYWHDEVLERDGVVWVPEAFCSVVAHPDLTPDRAPEYLAQRWVHTVARPPFQPPAGVRTRTLAGHPYVALADLGVRLARRGQIILIGADQVPFSGTLLDAVTTQFDTPERYADPALATAAIPTLARQQNWTAHAKVTPEQLAILQGDGTPWTFSDPATHDLTGFDATILGSAVPAPGIYPRVLFSEADLPALRERVVAHELGRRSLAEMGYLFERTWWNDTTSDGQVFRSLAQGDLDRLSWPELPLGATVTATPHVFAGQIPGIYSSHIAYTPECLTSMALYCLLTANDVRGRQVGAAIANYYRLREPLIDRFNATTDSEFGSGIHQGNAGSTTHWRSLHGLCGQMNLGLALDFSGRWMSAADKEVMRRVIAKCTYGRRAYGQDTSVRFRDVNWVGWDLPQHLALAAIEGLEGCDPEALESNRDTVKAFLQFGIDDRGVVYESNGKTAGSFTCLWLSLVTMARRGENLFGHPHLRQLLTAQAQMTAPTGQGFLNSGTQYTPHGRDKLSAMFVSSLHTAYPGDRAGEYLLSLAGPRTSDAGTVEYPGVWERTGLSMDRLLALLPKARRLRLPSPTYPGMTRSVLYDADWRHRTFADTGLPLDFIAPTHGVLSSRSDATPEALWLGLLVRPNHYLGAGHHHADAGMFHLSALGVDWLAQPRNTQCYDGRYFSMVTVDGHSQAERGLNAAATWLGGTAAAGGAAASADLTYAYSWRWMAQPGPTWSERDAALPWELDPTPKQMAIYAGTYGDKFRPWWPTSNYSNACPTLRTPFNPMRRVLRSTALVRGPHPYAVVVDDLDKDGTPHRFAWTGTLGGGVWQATVPGLAANQIALAWRPEDEKTAGTDRPSIVPAPGEPLLVLTALDLPASGTARVGFVDGPLDKQGRATRFEQVYFEVTAPAAHFTVVMTPLRMGEALPVIASSGEITWGSQRDRIIPQDGSRFAVQRAGTVIVATP